jgi:hypothetical protein
MCSKDGMVDDDLACVVPHRFVLVAPRSALVQPQVSNPSRTAFAVSDSSRLWRIAFAWVRSAFQLGAAALVWHQQEALDGKIDYGRADLPPNFCVGHAELRSGTLR